MNTLHRLLNNFTFISDRPIPIPVCMSIDKGLSTEILRALSMIT